MSAAFKNSGWLEGLNDTVMTDDIIDQFAQGYIQDMITDKDGNIVGVPGYTGYLAFWVNQEIMDEVGIESIDTKRRFHEIHGSSFKRWTFRIRRFLGKRHMHLMKLHSL